MPSNIAFSYPWIPSLIGCRYRIQVVNFDEKLDVIAMCMVGVSIIKVTLLSKKPILFQLP